MHYTFLISQALIGEVLGAFAATKSQAKPLTGFQFCEYLNISVCPASESDSVSTLAAPYILHWCTVKPVSSGHCLTLWLLIRLGQIQELGRYKH